MTTDEIAATGPGPAPRRLPIEAGVDGWTWTLPALLGKREGRVLARILGGVSLIALVLAVASSLVVHDLEATLNLVGLTSACAIAALGVVWMARRGERRVHLDREGLRLEGFGAKRDRTVPWATLGAPRVTDPRSDWDKAFVSSIVIVPGVDLVGTNRALAVRWTRNGRAAYLADHRTEWDGIVLGRNLSEESVGWLQAAIAHMAAAAQQREREARFDEIASRGAGAAALQELDALRGRSS